MPQVDRPPVTANQDEPVNAADEGRPRRTVNLGRGLVVPYPEPGDQAATRIGKANRRTNTKPEVRLRSLLHARGLRFRKDHLLRVGDLRVRPDIVFPRTKVAVFVDGCFWHSCPDHFHMPETNQEYWVPKLEGNVARDRRVDAALVDGGWQVVRVWEHENVAAAADQIESVLVARTAAGAQLVARRRSCDGCL